MAPRIANAALLERPIDLWQIETTIPRLSLRLLPAW